jgi:hypothetical protein
MIMVLKRMVYGVLFGKKCNKKKSPDFMLI